MITCNKCSGRVFVDRTFKDNRDYEVFCLLCGKRDFVGPRHHLFSMIRLSESRIERV